MDDETIPQFGTAMPGLDHGERPSAYGVALNAANRVLVCRRSRGRILLPGGGLHEGESPRQALEREVAEETGHRVIAAEPLGIARQFHSQRMNKPPVNKICHFFLVEVAHDPVLVSEEDHQEVWMSAHVLMDAFTFESHRWAVERAVLLQRQR